MKKFLVLFLVPALGAGALVIGLSCSTSAPSTPNNFQAPVQTISAMNPTFTFTPTYTFTNTPTITYTPTNTFTPNPYDVGSFTTVKNPKGVAADLRGYIYVADTGNNRVIKFNNLGTPVFSWGNGGKGRGAVTVTSPRAVAVDASSNLYVVGNFSGIYKFDPNGNPLGLLGTALVSNGSAVGIAVDNGGNIYVSTHSSITQLTSSGGLGTLLGGAGIVNSSSFSSSPVTLEGIALNPPNAFLFVATQSQVNPPVYCQVYSVSVSSGPVSITDATNGFLAPNAVAFDASGNLYVADGSSNNQVEEFLFSDFVTPALWYGQGNLSSPLGVAVDPSGNIYVADSTNNGGNGSIVKFAP